MSFLVSALTNGALGFGQQNTNQLQTLIQSLLSTNSSASSGTSSYNQNLNPAQTSVLTPTSSTITSVLSNPEKYVQPFTTAAVNQINDNYSGLADSLRKQFLQTGGGTSGKYGLALAQGNINRLNQISGAQVQGEQQAASLPLQASSLAEGLLGLNFGGTTTSAGSTTGTSSSSGSSTQNTQGSSTKFSI